MTGDVCVPERALRAMDSTCKCHELKQMSQSLQIHWQRGIGFIAACKEDWKYSSKHVISIGTIDLWKHPATLTKILLKEVEAFFSLNVLMHQKVSQVYWWQYKMQEARKIILTEDGFLKLPGWKQSYIWFQVPLLQKFG